jgi:hypothetical protein
MDKKLFTKRTNHLSREFLIRLKLNKQPAYRIAQQAGVNPNWLSRAINGIDEIKYGDPRITAVGKHLELDPQDCFEGLADRKATVSEDSLSGRAKELEISR